MLDTGCVLNATLRIISGEWKPVLIQQLKDLQADRVLTRVDYKEVPPRLDYPLTPLGRSC